MVRQAFNVPVNPNRAFIDSMAKTYAESRDLSGSFLKSWMSTIENRTPHSGNYGDVLEACVKASNKAQWTKLLYEYCGGLSEPSKMPCYSWSIPAHFCQTGSTLHKLSGTTCNACYALSGRYVMPNVKIAMARRLVTHKVSGRLDSTFTLVLSSFLRWNQQNPSSGIDGNYFRWFDSGDIQDDLMMRKIIYIAQLCPTVNFWLPTRELGLVSKYHRLPSNLVVRYSTPLVDTLSKRPDSTMVISSLAVLPEACQVCPATSNQSDHTCNGNNNCRSCWSAGHIGYILH